MSIGPLLEPYTDFLNSARNEDIEMIKFLDIEMKHYEKVLIHEKFTGSISIGRNLILHIGKYAIYIELGMHGRLYFKKWEVKNMNSVKLQLKIGDKFIYVYAPKSIRIYPKNEIRI